MVDPQIVGFPYHKDPKKVPLNSETPIWVVGRGLSGDSVEGLFFGLPLAGLVWYGAV